MYIVKTMIVLLLALDLSAAEKAEFKPFSSTEGRFTIAFPGKPEQATTTLKGPLGDIDAHSFIAKRSKDAESYAVTYCDLPVDLRQGLDAGEDFRHRAARGPQRSAWQARQRIEDRQIRKNPAQPRPRGRDRWGHDLFSVGLGR